MAKKILVIEDNQQVRENIVEILENEGFEMHQAENGTIGIEVAKRVQPELIICDVMMPGIDGFEVLSQLRKNILTSTIPFIFLTAKNTREDLRRGMQMGADDYISKPFTIEELLEAVQARLERIREFQEKSDAILTELRLNIGAPITKEINEPLKAIIGFSQMILTESMQMEKSEITEFVALIHSSGLKLNKIVLKTMLYYRLEALLVQLDNMHTLRQERTENVKKVAEESVRELAMKAGRADDLVLMIQDATLMMPKQFFVDMLTEIVDNALGFSPKHTLVKVVSGVEDQKYVITISDEGIGMSENQIAKIGAFMQFDKNSQQQDGIGLGLTIARRIVDLFNGSITLNSKQGMGTTVKVSLPATH